MNFAELGDGTLADRVARGEGQNNVMGQKNECDSSVSV